MNDRVRYCFYLKVRVRIAMLHLDEIQVPVFKILMEAHRKRGMYDGMYDGGS